MPEYNLSKLYAKLGKYTVAESGLLHVITILRREHITDRLALTYFSLGDLYSEEGKYREAETILRQALSIETASGHDPQQIARVYNSLGIVKKQLNSFADAEIYFKKAIDLFRESPQMNSGELETCKSNLSMLYIDEGRDADAEALLKPSILTSEANGLALARHLNNLGYLYTSEGRLAEAEPLIRKAIELYEKALGKDHPDVATARNNLAAILAERGLFADAEEENRRVLIIRERSLQPGHYLIAASLNNLAAVLTDEGKYNESIKFLQRALDMEQSTFGVENIETVRTQRNIASTLAQQGQHQKAEAAYQSVLSVRRKILGDENPDVARSMIELAAERSALGYWNSARVLSEQGVSTLIDWINRLESAQSYDAGNELRRYRKYLVAGVSIMFDQPQGGVTTESSSVPGIAFQATQVAVSATMGRTYAAMAARFGGSSNELAEIVRGRQDAAAELSALNSTLETRTTNPGALADAATILQFRNRLDGVEARLSAFDNRISHDFPAYAELTNPKPVRLAEAQGLLGEKEAMLVFLVADDATYLWTLRRDRSDAVKIDITDKALGDEVEALRRLLDPKQNSEGGPFDVERAYALYQKILGPAAPLLEGADHVIVVPDGPLQSLPLGVLVTKPAAAVHDPVDYRKVAWFARDHAVTVVPAVASLRALRQSVKPSSAPNAFVGVGDPVLSPPPQCRQAATMTAMFRGAEGNVGAVKQLCSLPESRDELNALARAEGTPGKDLYLADQATKPIVTKLPLANYRIVAFATHGLVAGELKNLAEPALVLTPPSAPTEGDDGLLTASDVAQLKLDADWVILSACNTAAGEKPGAEGLSGLAKAFFYAGARSLLVSHWSVGSVAAQELTVDTLGALRKEPGIGRAEALRRAEMDMLDNRTPDMAHPMAWAPFALVGEGAPRIDR